MDYDVEVSRIYHVQLSLFPIKPLDVCNRIGLNWLTAEILYENALLSFNPSEIEQLNSAQEAELVFLGNLVVAGCSIEMLEQLLKTLKKPYQYKSDEIYYDWNSQKWQRMPHFQESIKEKIARDWLEDLNKGQWLFDWIDELEPKHVFTDWIDDLLNNGDMEQLIEIERECKWAISKLRNE